MTPWRRSCLLGLGALAIGALQGAVQPAQEAHCVAQSLSWGDLDGDGRLGREEFIALRLLSMDHMIALKEHEVDENQAHPQRGQAYRSPEVKALRLQRIAGRADSEQLFVQGDRNGDDHLDRLELAALCGQMIRRAHDER